MGGDRFISSRVRSGWGETGTEGIEIESSQGQNGLIMITCFLTYFYDFYCFCVLNFTNLDGSNGKQKQGRMISAAILQFMLL